MVTQLATQDLNPALLTPGPVFSLPDYTVSPQISASDSMALQEALTPASEGDPGHVGSFAESPLLYSKWLW